MKKTSFCLIGCKRSRINYQETLLSSTFNSTRVGMTEHTENYATIVSSTVTAFCLLNGLIQWRNRDDTRSDTSPTNTASNHTNWVARSNTTNNWRPQWRKTTTNARNDVKPLPTSEMDHKLSFFPFFELSWRLETRGFEIICHLVWTGCCDEVRTDQVTRRFYLWVSTYGPADQGRWSRYSHGIVDSIFRRDAKLLVVVRNDKKLSTQYYTRDFVR